MLLDGEKRLKRLEELEEAITKVSVLALPDFSQLFELETDASRIVVGAVLMKNGRPIAYFSQALSSKARKSLVYERELMAIVLAIKRWHHTCLGILLIRTDQKDLK